MSTLVGYVIRMSGRHQIWICLLAVVVAGIGLAPLELQRRILDDAVIDKDVDLIITLGLIYLAVTLLHGALKYFLRMYQGWLSESAIRYNREHLAGMYECRRASADETNSGKAVSIIAKEIDQLGGFVGEGLSQLAVNTVLLLSIGAYMIIVEPMVALFSLPFLLPQLIITPIIQRRINHRIEQRVEFIRMLSKTVSAIPTDQKDLSGTSLLRELDGIYANRIRIFLLKFGLKAALNLLNALAPLSALCFGGYMVIQGETSIGVVVAFVSGFQRMAGPVRELATFYRVAAQAGVQHRMIAQWM